MATIITKNSSTASSVPLAAQLVQGELAVNVTDKRLFTENSGGTVVELGTNPSSLSTGALAYTGTLTGGTGVVNLGSGQLYKDASGNVGIGVTPAAWDAANKAFQVSSGSMSAGTASVSFSQNAYYNAGWKYIATSTATQYDQYAGQHRWFNAPSGTAGNAITFTQAMTLDSSGNLLVGTTSANAKLTVVNTGFAISGETSATANSAVVFFSKRTSNGIQMRFDQSGTVCGDITTTGSSTSYGTSSDYRLKEAVQPMQGALAKVAALKPVTYTWTATGQADEGFIAHELQAVCPSAVTGEKDAVDADGNPQYQGIDTSFLVATLAAAIQELKAIVDAQGAEIAALKSI